MSGTKEEIAKIRKELTKKASKEYALSLQRFFKTKVGEYGYGDVFIGVRIPDIRQIAKSYKVQDLKIVKEFLASEIHEERTLALLFLVQAFSKSGEKEQEKIVTFYLKNTKHINNWDLVDLSAHKILGPYYFERDRSILYDLVESKNLWERRIAIITSFHFILKSDFHDSLKLAKILLKDKEDLIHKATGWMIREIWKRSDGAVVEVFLKKNYKDLSRTTLRYAIERMPENKRKIFLLGKFLKA
jgi:3-methyladenine DNA glycosylase AlkD